MGGLIASILACTLLKPSTKLFKSCSTISGSIVILIVPISLKEVTTSPILSTSLYAILNCLESSYSYS
jgi:hypothetical protein